MESRVFIFEVDGYKALGFDTGLDSRAFAQAKFAQCITEPGIIVRLGDTADPPVVETWKVSGVAERGNMVVWGPPFEGEHLDKLINDNIQRDKALNAIACWIRAIIALGENPNILFQPYASIIKLSPPAAVFFAPPQLALRCVMANETSRLNNERYIHNNPGITNAAAFTAAAMLYNIFAEAPPFTAADEITFRQDMRDGNFLPVHLAVPGLDAELAGLIQTSLMPPAFMPQSPDLPGNKNSNTAGKVSQLQKFLEVLQPGGGFTVSSSSIINPLSNADILLIEKEKTQFLKVKNVSVKTKRFIARNTALLLGSFAAIVAVILIARSITSSRAGLPNTAGMDPVQVIESYYYAFEELDHQMMEACVIKGAGKDDISMVVNLFVINKVRQVYEMYTPPSIRITDLTISNERLSVSNDRLSYRVDYTLWFPFNNDSESFDETAEHPLPDFSRRTDLVNLTRVKGNWRISEIHRTENN
jgi:hypothetical protein